MGHFVASCESGEPIDWIEDYTQEDYCDDLGFEDEDGNCDLGNHPYPYD
ncbi:MAG: hypothetical protein K0V04_35150 [Deltaproteobacteria bacterium]|nr:hypothetical protein [Deltaproteobacteria bacterium]